MLKTFFYPGSFPNPEVLVTSENQHEVRGFNLAGLFPAEEEAVMAEWRMVRNQNWPITTKERVALRRSGVQCFRRYKKEHIDGMSRASE